MSDGTVDFSLYNSWKSKNFFSTSESTASSTLWDDQNNTYANINFDALISDSNKKPPLPVVYIDCGGSGFTKAVYEAVGANPTEYTGCTFNYFDPNSTKSSAVSTGELSVQIQGTSSTGYRSKNLEIIFRELIRVYLSLVNSSKIFIIFICFVSSNESRNWVFLILSR